MSPGKLENSSSSCSSFSPHYESLPQPQMNNPNEDDFVLPLFIPIPYRLSSTGIISFVATLVLLSTSVYIIWPSEPQLTVVLLRLRKFNTRAFPLDISLDVMVRVRNRGVHSLVYEGLKVWIMYRGNRLGFVKSDGGEVRAGSYTYVNATLRVDGIEVLLTEDDMARGFIPIHTVMEVQVLIGFLFSRLPLKAKVSCEVDINTTDHTIDRQNCYPQVRHAYVT